MCEDRPQLSPESAAGTRRLGWPRSCSNGSTTSEWPYQTADIDAALDQVRAAGLELIDEQPRVGIRGSRVAFLHPKATNGVLTELVEPAH